MRSDFGVRAPFNQCFEPNHSFFSSRLNQSPITKWRFLYGYWCLFFIFFSLLWLCCLISSGLSSVVLSDSLQMDVVSAFQSGTSFQGALRRQASNSSQQQHDVTNVSSPTHVAFTTTTTATAANSASATVGCECVFSFSAWDFFYFLFLPLTSFSSTLLLA